MQLKDTQDALNAFGRYVVQQSRSRLTKGGKNASNALYDSLGYDLKVMPNSAWCRWYTKNNKSI